MVKLEIIIALVLMANIAHAQIFKCETQQGKIIYQDLACKNSSQQREIIVKHYAPEKTLQAQNKLRKELYQRQELENIKAEQDLRERQVLAIEAQARSNENLADATYENVDALDRNTESSGYRNSRNDLYYYNPRGYKSRKVTLNKRNHYKKSGIASSYNSYNPRKKTKAIRSRIPHSKTNHFNPPLRQSNHQKPVSKHYTKQGKKYPR